MNILIVGGTGGTTIGSSFLRAAQKERFNARLLDSSLAYGAHPIMKRIWWHVFGRRPYYLGQFSRLVLETAVASKADLLLTTGIAPVNAAALEQLGSRGIKRINYLTDDPWNPGQKGRWFLRALPHYDHIFSPRRANLGDLQLEGCREVHYLPFGYDEELWYPDAPKRNDAHRGLVSDVLFAGGADQDRIPYMEALIAAGLRLRLYGSYWERYAATKSVTAGQADPTTIRQGLSVTRIGLCLVRRANRDGNSMRTFEVPATGACLLAEDTSEHREIFGSEGRAALFFSTVADMLKKVKFLLENEEYRSRLAKEGHTLITRGRNTYRDRLLQICECAVRQH